MWNMEVVYFSKKKQKHDPFLNAIKNAAPKRQVSAYTRIDEFKKRLAERQGRKLLAVIIAVNEETLIDIYFAQYLLAGISSILVLPDDEKHTVALGCRIGPKHTFPIDTDMGGFTSTVAKILEEGSIHSEGKAANF